MGRKNLPASAPVKTAEMPRPAKLWPVWCALAACVWVAFSPILSNGFVDWDDPQWILSNHAFRGLGWDQIHFAFTTFKGGVYQPLGWLVQSLTYELYGLDARGYHLLSLVIHVVNAVLLHLLCVRILTRTMPEAAAHLGGSLGWLCGIPVVLYAIHPLRVEPVAWASCQAYLPSVTFSLLATLAYLRANPSLGVFRPSWMIASSVLIVLAVLTKGSAVVLPFVFLILDVYPLRRFDGMVQNGWLAGDRVISHGRADTSPKRQRGIGFASLALRAGMRAAVPSIEPCRFDPGRPCRPVIGKVLVEKGPILVFCLALTAVAFVAKQPWLDSEVTTQSVLVGRVAQASFAAWFYLEKTIWPLGITAFYPHPENEEFRTPLFAACCAGVVLAVLAAFWLGRRRPYLPAALTAYLVIASPYLGLVRVGVPLAADRYSYGPMVAWVVLGCAGLARLAQRRWSRPVLLSSGAGMLMVACGLMALCSAQCRMWERNERLWSHALEHAGWSSHLHHFMGTTFAEEGKFEPAIAEFREALRIRPHHFEAICDLGVALENCGDTRAAVAYLREAVSLQPNNAKAYLNLGAVLVRQGHVDEAIALYREGLRFEPNFPNLHLNLGIALIHQRKLDEAIDELKRAVELRPWYTEAHAVLGGAFVLRGQQEKAIAQYQEVLRLDPDHSAARINLALALAREGRSPDAIAQLRQATLRDPQNPEAHHVLGAILVTSGRVREAAAEFEEVLRLRPDHAQARAFLAKAKGRRM
jgi:Flp pilus assembly protein TadD